MHRKLIVALQWRHNEREGVSNHQSHDCLVNRLFRLRSNKTSKLRVTGLCEGISPVTLEFPAQRACNAEKVSIWWRHHGLATPGCNGSIQPQLCAIHDNITHSLGLNYRSISWSWRYDSKLHIILSPPNCTAQCRQPAAAKLPFCYE